MNRRYLWSGTKAGSLTWLMSAMGRSDVRGDVFTYGTIVCTGHTIVGWLPDG
jgi:2-aminophenol/2-amino-5-chlorophenol 1,6-dioxygenase beta subunit